MDIAAESRAHQDRVRAAEDKCRKELAQHATDYQAALVKAETQRVAECGAPFIGTWYSAAWLEAQTRIENASTNCTRRKQEAARIQVQKDADSQLAKAKAINDSVRNFQDKQAQHDTFLKKWKVQKEAKYQSDMAAAEKKLAQDLASAQKTQTASVADALKQYSIKLAQAQSTLRTDRLSAALSAVSAWATATDTPWSGYQKSLLENQVSYVAAVSPQYVEYLSGAAEALRKQRADDAGAAQVRSDAIAVAGYDRTVERAAADKDFLTHTLDNTLTRSQSDHKAARDHSDKLAEAQAGFERDRVAAITQRGGDFLAAFNDCTLDRKKAEAAYYGGPGIQPYVLFGGTGTPTGTQTNPEAVYNTALAAAWQRLGERQARNQWQLALDEIAAYEARALKLTAVERKYQADSHAAEKKWIADNAGETATRDRALAAADAKYVKNTEDAYGTELASQAAHQATRTGSVAAKWKEFANFGATQADTYDQRDVTKWAGFLTSTLDAYDTALDNWNSTNRPNWNTTQAASADLRLGQFDEEQDFIGKLLTAVQSNSSTVGAAAKGTICDENDADATLVQAESDAEAGPGGWVQQIVAASDSFTQTVADRRAEHAKTVAEKTRDHDQQVAEENRKYQDKLATEAEARQNAWDAAEWKYLRAQAWRNYAVNGYIHQITSAQSTTMEATEARQRLQAQVTAEKNYLIHTAEARVARTEAVGDLNVTYVDALGTASVTLAGHIRTATGTLADATQSADSDYAEESYGAEEDWSHTYSDSDPTHQLCDAESVFDKSSQSAACDFEEDCDSLSNSYATGIFSNYTKAMADQAKAQVNSPLAQFHSDLAGTDLAWLDSATNASGVYQRNSSEASAEATDSLSSIAAGAGKAIAAKETSASKDLATALKNEGTGWEDALAAATAKVSKADAQRAETQVAARAEYDTALATARADYDDGLAQADLAWAKRMAEARAAMYLAGDTADAQATYNAAKEHFDRLLDRDQAKAATTYAADVGWAQIEQEMALGEADVTYAGKEGDAVCDAVADINTAESGFASTYANITNTVTSDLSQTLTGVLNGVVGAVNSLDSKLSSAMASAVSSLGTAAVTWAAGAAEDEATFQSAQAAGNYNAAVARAGASGPSTQLALVRKTWLDGLSTALVAAATARASADADLDNRLIAASAAASAQQGSSQLAFVQTLGSSLSAYWDGTVADQMTAYQNSVSRENTWLTQQAGFDKTTAVARAGAAGDYLVAMATADRDYQVAFAQTDERYQTAVVERGTVDQTQYLQTQVAAGDIQLKSQTSAGLIRIYRQTNLAGTTQSAATSTREYLLGESAGTATLQTNLAQRGYTFATATLGARAAQAMAGAAAEIGYASAARSALNDWNTDSATAWSDFRSADYTQRATSLVSFASTLGTPWAQFQLAQSQTESAWWTSRTGAYQSLVSSLNAAEDQYQADDNAHYLSLRATQIQADSSYAQATASLDYSNALAQTTAEGAFVQATVPAAEQYQVSSITVEREVALNTALYAAERSTTISASSAVLTRPAYTGYASAYMTAAADRRTALAMADQTYRSGSAAADSAYSATYADAQQNYDVAQSLSSKTRALAVDLLLSDYRRADRTTYADALYSLAETNGTPWAWLAADQAAAWAVYASSAASATTDRTGAETDAAHTQVVQRAAADRQLEQDQADARAANQTRLGRVAVDRAVAENGADADAAASGQYTCDEPDWGLEEDWSDTPPEYENNGGDYETGTPDATVSAALSRLFNGASTQGPTTRWTTLPCNYQVSDYSSLWDTRLVLAGQNSGNSAVNTLQADLVLPVPPDVSLDGMRHATTTVSAQATTTVSQTASSTSPAARSTPSTADWETYKTAVKTAGSRSSTAASVSSSGISQSTWQMVSGSDASSIGVGLSTAAAEKPTPAWDGPGTACFDVMSLNHVARHVGAGMISVARTTADEPLGNGEQETWICESPYVTEDPFSDDALGPVILGIDREKPGGVPIFLPSRVWTTTDGKFLDKGSLIDLSGGRFIQVRTDSGPVKQFRYDTLSDEDKDYVKQVAGENRILNKFGINSDEAANIRMVHRRLQFYRVRCGVSEMASVGRFIDHFDDKTLACWIPTGPSKFAKDWLEASPPETIKEMIVDGRGDVAIELQATPNTADSKGPYHITVDTLDVPSRVLIAQNAIWKNGEQLRPGTNMEIMRNIGHEAEHLQRLTGFLKLADNAVKEFDKWFQSEYTAVAYIGEAVDHVAAILQKRLQEWLSQEFVRAWKREALHLAFHDPYYVKRARDLFALREANPGGFKSDPRYWQASVAMDEFGSLDAMKVATYTDSTTLQRSLTEAIQSAKEDVREYIGW